MEPKILLPPEGDTPEKKSPLASTEEQSREKVYGSESMVMEGDSGNSEVTEQKSEGYFKILDQIQEKASSILKFSLHFDDVRDSLEKEEERLRVVEMREKEIGLIEKLISRRLSVLEEKEIESDLRLVIEATIMRLVLEKQSEDVVTYCKTQEDELDLLLHSTTKKLEDLRSEFESIGDKLCELERAEKDIDLKQRAETENRNEESEARKKEFRALEEAIKEKTAELKKKEETFELKLKEEAEKLREETDLKRKSLEIKEKTLEKRLEDIELKDENSILSACGRFQYGGTEIKSHLMFAHEMHHITCANNVIVNPRKGETWALFRDWNVSWNSHPDVYEPPYRYDFVEVISEFDNLRGIAVEYMGRVEGFVSVFKHAEQHGLIKIMITPGEMQRFSHKVASVKLSGEEKEGISAGSFELNPAATPSYDPVLDEVMEMKIQSKDCGKASNVVDQNGSTKDLPIIID